MSLLSAAMFANAAVNKISEEELKTAFQRPLITGASVSADWRAPSPGKKLAGRFTSSDRIKTIAYGGTPGSMLIESLSESQLKDRTVVIALDFFFWDSAFLDARPSLKALQSLVKLSKNLKVPLVLGEIPELLPGRQPMRAKLNSALAQACAEYSKCFLMPFIDLHGKVKKDRHLIVDGKARTISELLPDGLHVSSLGSEYLAEVMKDVMLGKVR